MTDRTRRCEAGTLCWTTRLQTLQTVSVAQQSLPVHELSSQRLRRVRSAIQDSQSRAIREARRVADTVRPLAERIGRVDVSAGWPIEIRRQHFSTSPTCGQRRQATGLARLAQSPQNVFHPDDLTRSEGPGRVCCAGCDELVEHQFRVDPFRNPDWVVVSAAGHRNVF